MVANTPHYNRLIRECPHTAIAASGAAVGLPGHEVGNSEVGHMNLGAGRIVEQDISLINRQIAEGSFYKNRVILKAMADCRNAGSTLHLIGIVSDGGIHSHINHLLALLKMAKDMGNKKVLIHAITDGRDTPPQKGIEFINKLEYACNRFGVGKIATIIGRIYLDRKGNWSRTKVLYDLLTEGRGIGENNSRSAISNAYRNGQMDEYIVPRKIKYNYRKIQNRDAVIFFNFRSDRTKQITQAFLDEDFKFFRRKYLPDLDFVTFIPYGTEMEVTSRAKPAFPSVTINNTLAAYVENLNLKQFHIAETEKFAHVTYFFNGNINDPYKGEDRTLVPSPDVGSYAEKPEMSIDSVTSNLVKIIARKEHHFMLCNFANGDMVGHTGDFKAAVAAVESIDHSLREVLKSCVDNETNVIITADHGNIEQMVDPETGQPDPEHTRNPVPLILFTNKKDINLKGAGRLGNVVATALAFSNYQIPKYFFDNLIS